MRCFCIVPVALLLASQAPGQVPVSAGRTHPAGAAAATNRLGGVAAPRHAGAMAAFDEAGEAVVQTAVEVERSVDAIAGLVTNRIVSYDETDAAVLAVIRQVSGGLAAVSGMVRTVAARTARVADGTRTINGQPVTGMLAVAYTPTEDGTARTVDPFVGDADWIVEDWGDTGTVKSDGDRLHVDYTVGANRKFAITKVFARKLTVRPAESLVVDVENLGAYTPQVAIGLFCGARYLESRAAPIKSGQRRVVFKFSEKNFKAEDTRWQYTASVDAPMQLDKLTLLLYASRPGKLLLDEIRLETGTPPASSVPTRRP